jgi:DNA-binding transcriptional LysR family regulator
MDRFAALQALVTVIDEGGFAAAANKLGLSPPVVTRQIAALEAELRTRLITRTTRSMALTEAGVRYGERARAILHDLKDANAAARGDAVSGFGTLRIAAVASVGRAIIVPALANFLSDHPTATAEFDVLDRPVDAAREGYDLVLSLVKQAHPQDVLAQVPVGMVAAPAYCARNGRPKAPDDLGGHVGLMLADDPTWHLRDGRDVRPKSRLTVNQIELLQPLCLAGLGIAVVPLYLITDTIARNELLLLLDGFEPKPYKLVWQGHGRRPLGSAGVAFLRYLSTAVRGLAP